MGADTSSIEQQTCDHSVEKKIYSALLSHHPIPRKQIMDAIRCPECGTLDLLKMLRDETKVDFADNQHEPVNQHTVSTYLHFASRFNTLDVIRFLVEECGADVNERDFINKRPIHEVTKRKDGVPIVDYLVSKGANLHVFTPDSEGPGITAIIFHNPAVLRRMCELGLNVRGTAHAYDGETPTSFAVRNSNVKCLHILYKYGADVRNFYANNDENSIANTENPDVRKFLAWAVFDEFCRIGRPLPLKNAELYPWRDVSKGLVKRILWMYKLATSRKDALLSVWRRLPTELGNVIWEFIAPSKQAADFLLKYQTHMTGKFTRLKNYRKNMR